MSGRWIGGRYLLERRLAGGGMGSIWLARDRQLERQVALKLIAPMWSGSPEARRRFQEEARVVAQLQHPHVVQIHDYGVDEDTPYLVMELLEGEDLEARLSRQGRLAPAVVAGLLNQVSRALGAAHAAGVIHRDLKPANLFLARVDAEEVVKVLDFGLALREEAAAAETGGTVAGTLRYMSPEQVRSETRLDHRSDLWSLAVVVYRALTGRLPFSKEAISELMHWKPGMPPVAPESVAAELGAEADAFFARALALDPAQRFQSAREMAAAFAGLVESRRVARATRLLVVDDEPDVALLMKQWFRRQIRERVYEFIFATDGEDALQKLREHPDIEVVLSDINMPRMDGLTFLARVGEVNPLVKVIIVSAYGDMSNIRVAMNRGAFDFLMKPIDFQDLETTLEKTIKHAAELRQAVRSTEENRLLRMFVHGGIVERVLPLVRGPEALGGERLEATVAFLHVKDFAAAARGERPDAAIRRLNANFEVLLPELAARGGEADKFIGDALMAVFRGPGHLERALESCLAARQQLQVLAQRYGEQSPYGQGLCIGLDSGELIYGSVGARALGRLDYTVLGEVVYRAAWLASVAGRGQLLVHEELRPRLQEHFECAPQEKGNPPRTVLEVVQRRHVRPVTPAGDTLTLERQLS